MPRLGSLNEPSAPTAPTAAPAEGTSGSPADEPTDAAGEYLLRVRVSQHPTPITISVPSPFSVATVREVKVRLLDQYNSEHRKEDAAPAQSCKFIGRGREMKDEQTLSSYSLANGELIHGILSETAPVGTTDSRRSAGGHRAVTAGLDSLLTTGISRDEIGVLRTQLMNTFTGLSTEERRQREEDFMAPVDPHQYYMRHHPHGHGHGHGHRRQRADAGHGDEERRSREEAPPQTQGEPPSADRTTAGLTEEEQRELEQRAVQLVDTEQQAARGSGAEAIVNILADDNAGEVGPGVTPEDAQSAARKRMLQEMGCIIAGIFLGPVTIVFLGHEGIPLKFKLSLTIGVAIHLLFALYGINSHDLEYVR